MDARPFRRGIALLCVLALAQPTALPQVEAATPGGFTAFAPWFNMSHGFSTTLFIRNNHMRIPAAVTPEPGPGPIVQANSASKSKEPN